MKHARIGRGRSRVLLGILCFGADGSEVKDHKHNIKKKCYRNMRQSINLCSVCIRTYGVSLYMYV